MLSGGLGLKGLALSLFALVFSFTRSGRTMFESEESLAECFGFSREHVNITLKNLIGNKLVARISRHEGLQTYDYCVDISTVVRMLGPPGCEDPQMLKAFYRSISKPGLDWCEKILHTGMRKSDTRCEKTSQQDVRKPNTACEEISHNNNSNKEIDKNIDNVVSALSKEDLKDILYPIFFFKNNCDYVSESSRFIDYYREKGWKLGGGGIIQTVPELQKIAESWQVKEKKYTGLNPNFMKGWKVVYKEVPAHLKKDVLQVKVPVQSPTSAKVKCTDALTIWLNENREKVELIFQSYATYNYKIEW